MSDLFRNSKNFEYNFLGFTKLYSWNTLETKIQESGPIKQLSTLKVSENTMQWSQMYFVS